MDKTTVYGLVAGLVTLAISCALSTKNLLLFWDTHAFITVVGGVVAAIIVAMPIEFLRSFPNVLRKAFKEDGSDLRETIAFLIRLAEVARRDGVLAMEKMAHEVKDRFLLMGIYMAVDGFPPEAIEDLLHSDLEMSSARHGKMKKMVESLGNMAPAFGLVGTLIGLVSMLANLDDPSQISKGMAVALVCTLYGAVSGNLIFLPMAYKLDFKNVQEGNIKKLIIRGLCEIQAGENPKLVGRKLQIFLPEKAREMVTDKSTGG